MIKYNLIVAVDQNNGIGKGGILPWHLPEDLKHFKNVTTKTDDAGKKNAVIMGRKTWESIPEKYRPLPDRINIVLTRADEFTADEDVCVVNDLNALNELSNQLIKDNVVEHLFIIGGAEIFKLAIENLPCKHLYLTKIEYVFECDIFLPDLLDQFSDHEELAAHQNDQFSFKFLKYTSS